MLTYLIFIFMDQNDRRGTIKTSNLIGHFTCLNLSLIQDELHIALTGYGMNCGTDDIQIAYPVGIQLIPVGLLRDPLKGNGYQTNLDMATDL